MDNNYGSSHFHGLSFSSSESSEKEKIEFSTTIETPDYVV